MCELCELCELSGHGLVSVLLWGIIRGGHENSDAYESAIFHRPDMFGDNAIIGPIALHEAHMGKSTRSRPALPLLPRCAA
jgi:hypothetical protein